MKNKTFHKRKILVVFAGAFAMIFVLIGRLTYLMVFDAEYYQKKAEDLHERERDIKAARGEILDRNGKVLATNRTVCTISVIHSQIREAETVIDNLSELLEMNSSEVRKRVEKISSIERIKSNVDKKTGDKIRNLGMAGVKVDEDFKRFYPYDALASKVLGFTGADNQGIIGLEVKYDKYLKGVDGKILTTTDARGIELDGVAEDRKEPVAGNTLKISLDYNMQKYAMQMAEKVRQEKQAEKTAILLMNPQNGEIYAMVNVPEFNLNRPFELNTEEESDENMTDEQKQDALNQMWRNGCINDTYEPGSTFKIITASAGLEEGVVRLTDQFQCPGYKMVEDRRIRCHKVGGHGTENFVQGIQNSCNPVFIELGLRIGVDRFCDYFHKFGLMNLTGVDIPGEAGTIMHKKENIGQVELATISFGQSFQITPLQLMRAASAVVNGGNLVTPHFGVYTTDENNNVTEVLKYETKTGAVSTATSETMKGLLEAVVAEGTGHRAYIAGYSIGGKTATSEKLPRSENRYISSFLGFSPADNPQVMTLILIDEPQGIYYGGTIAAPVVGEIYDNILPYLGIYKDENAEEETTQTISIDDAVF